MTAFPCFAMCGKPACAKLGCIRVYNDRNREPLGGFIHQPTTRIMGVDQPDLGKPLGAASGLPAVREPDEPRLAFDAARDEIAAKLDDVLNRPHAEHFGPFCPVCGLVTRLQAVLRDWKPS